MSFLKRRSALLRNVNKCLRENVRDYRAEIHQLGMDKRVAQELEYDLQEEERRKSGAVTTKPSQSDVTTNEKPTKTATSISPPSNDVEENQDEDDDLPSRAKPKKNAKTSSCAPSAQENGADSRTSTRNPPKAAKGNRASSSAPKGQTPIPPTERQPLAALNASKIPARNLKTDCGGKCQPEDVPNDENMLETSGRASLVIKSSQFSIPRVRRQKEVQVEERDESEEDAEEEPRAPEKVIRRGNLSLASGRRSTWNDKSFAVVSYDLEAPNRVARSFGGRFLSTIDSP
ncbi:hypothetical protein M427DRAFT_210574 [Gonapodya prolifera JEL478]|uniref:Uncharacterized protein n=1 Tax=Gonapodya prolifera (strain JEL478) TaxID=1344416 RepID=A0A139APK8_GONPJ|nr:hypothetical protein M427DRAFT_210574 [Gonapodya prolifera JEL478]|eukprot:KXS18443.1 hypothetical protein M427DRAFT_210574 [Gonapodya prolifera JEL478]